MFHKLISIHSILNKEDYLKFIEKDLVFQALIFEINKIYFSS